MTVKKTTRRDFYDGERERIGAGNLVDEVIFLNANEEVCEGSFTSIFVEKDGQLFTPDLSSGLLPGILRQHYLETGKAESKVLTLTDLSAADAIYVGNSLRGLMPAQFINMLRH